MRGAGTASDTRCMSYLGLDEDRLLAVVDGLNRIFAAPLNLQDVTEEGAMVAMALVGATGASVVVTDEAPARVFSHGDTSTVGSELSIRMEREGRALGSMVLVKRSDDGFSEPDGEVFKLLATGLAAQVEHALEHELAVNESRVDPLTGLGNRLAFDERLTWELSRSSRYGEKLSLALFEIDDFGGLEVRFGPEATDRIVEEVAEVLSRGRSADSCFRLESDTFAVVMPNTAGEGAEIAAIRIAWRVASLRGGDIVTVNTGVAEADVPDPRVLLAMSEASLRSARLPADA